jgi:hypothetical protein
MIPYDRPAQSAIFPDAVRDAIDKTVRLIPVYINTVHNLIGTGCSVVLLRTGTGIPERPFVHLHELTSRTSSMWTDRPQMHNIFYVGARTESTKCAMR